MTSSTSVRVSALSVIFTLLYGLVGLGLGAFFSVINKSYMPQLPYTVVVFFAGLFLSLGLVYYDVRAASLSSYNTMLANDVTFLLENPKLGSQLIVYFFLPILIFGETMHLNWHHATSALAQATWLAGPGAVIGCIIMGGVAYGMFNEWMDLNVAFMFGAILSATDPVAVIALLKTSKASHSLTLLIVGESLLNDGSAMVLYSLFDGLYKGDTKANFTSILVFFLLDALCSVLFGIAIGFITNRLMRYFDHPIKGTDMNIQVILTLLSAYVSFNVAQAQFLISGVLSASAAGLMLSWLAPPFILHHETMETVWGAVEWICNTLIFFFAGLESGYAVYKHGEWKDLSMVVTLYVILFFIRVFVVGVLYPIVSRGTLKCSVHDAMFMTWAGLRGALGIGLALLVEDSLNHSTRCTNEGTNKTELCESKFFIYIVGIAACTLIFNATSANWLLRRLKLVSDKEVSFQKRMVIDRIRRNFRHKLKAECEEELGKDFGGCDPQDLIKLCRLLGEVKVDDADESLSQHKYLLDDMDPISEVRNSEMGDVVTEQRLSTYRDDDNGSDSKTGIQVDLLDYARSSFLRNLRVIYTDAVFTGKIGRASYASQALMNSLDIAMDFVDSPELGLRDWDALIEVLDIKSAIVGAARKFDNFLMKIGIFTQQNIYAYVVARRDRRLVYALTNFISAHEASQKLIPLIFGGEKNDMESVKGIPEAEQVLWESTLEVEKANARLATFHKETIDRFYLQRAARIILIKQSAMVNAMIAEGTLAEKDAALFYDIISKDHEHVNRERELLNK